MELTQQQCILMNLLNCGYADLDFLEGINYDIDDIITSLKEDDILSFNNIIKEVFYKGIYDLNDCFVNNKKDILTEILNSIHWYIDDCLYNRKDFKELSNNKEFKSYVDDFRLINNDVLNPINQ